MSLAKLTALGLDSLNHRESNLEGLYYFITSDTL